MKVRVASLRLVIMHDIIFWRLVIMHDVIFWRLVIMLWTGWDPDPRILFCKGLTFVHTCITDIRLETIRR